jgi:hypothetical protein
MDSFRFKNFKLDDQPFMGSYEAAILTIDTLIDGVFENIRLKQFDGKKVPFAADYTLTITDMIIQDQLASHDEKLDDKYLDCSEEPMPTIIDGLVKDVIKRNKK